MANESFAEFAETLQREIETETGVKFGVLQLSLFSGMTYAQTETVERVITPEQAAEIIHHAQFRMQDDETPIETVKRELEQAPHAMESVVAQTLGSNCELCIVNSELKSVETITVEKTVSYEDAAGLMEHFEKNDYITKSGKIKDTMKNALLNGTLDLPKKFEAARSRFESMIARADQRPPVRDASREVTVRLNKQVLISPAFKELWERIQQKTAYRVQIDTEKLVSCCVRDLQNMPPIPKARLVTQTADIQIENTGVTHLERGMKVMDLQSTYETLPHIISIISEETLLKRDTVRRILVESGRSADFLNNPQGFLEKALTTIRHNRHELAIDGIKYVKLDCQEYFAMEIFDTAELAANLDKDAVAVEHSVYDYVIYDSATVEKPFAVALDRDPDVKLFFKIPARFKIETPIGTYNPDWAVYMEQDGCEKLYFVVETKGTADTWNLRTTEQLKIHCGEQHFKALQNGVSLYVAKNWNEFKVQQ